MTMNFVRSSTDTWFSSGLLIVHLVAVLFESRKLVHGFRRYLLNGPGFRIAKTDGDYLPKCDDAGQESPNRASYKDTRRRRLVSSG